MIIFPSAVAIKFHLQLRFLNLPTLETLWSRNRASANDIKPGAMCLKTKKINTQAILQLQKTCNSNCF